MSGFKDQQFGERLNTAANAKRATLERFRARPAADDPAVIERGAFRQAISVARQARAAERETAREADAARQAAERAARFVEQQARDAAAEAERKAARDARYAARKARR